MRISSLISSTHVLRSSAVQADPGPTELDGIGKLYQVALQKVNPKLKNDPNPIADGSAFIYSRQGIIAKGTAIAPCSVVLENADGSRFNVDTAGKTLSLVAKGRGIDLYVFSPNSAAQGSPNNSQAVKYSFDGAGVMKSTGAVTNLTAMDLSDAEITVRRDLDGNGKIGGGLSTATVTGNASNSGKRVAVDGIFKVNVMDRDLFVVGAKSLEKQKNINAKGSTLLNADGSGPWSPVDSFQGVTFSSYRAVKTNANNISWTVYATNASTGEVARFQFDNDLKLNETSASPVMLSGAELIDAEASSKRDFNADGVFGAKINSATDAAGGLYQADFLGATVYLSKVSATQTDTTGGLPVNADGQLLLANGTAWAGAGNGYQIASMVKSGQNGGKYDRAREHNKASP